MNVLRLSSTLAVLASLSVGCVGPQAQAPSGALTPQYNKDTGRLDYLDYDRNKDGKVEVRAYMDGTRIQRVELDKNDDGKPDRWEYYVADERPSASKGGSVIVRAEEATDYNGTISRWEYYEGGVVVRADEDADGDGRVDKWERYTGGRLASIELDLTGSGKPNRRLVYEAGGSVTETTLGPGEGRKPQGS